MGAVTRCLRRSQEQRHRSAPAGWEVLVLPFRIHQIDAALLGLLRKAPRGDINGSAS
jgi:hypothetical protein